MNLLPFTPENLLFVRMIPTHAADEVS